MFKKLLYVLFATDRVKLESNQMTAVFLVLYFISFWIMSLSGGALVASALFCFTRIATWACIAWMWAELLWLNKYSLFRDRGKYL